ncbi:alpha/beta hydrolase [Streptomyces sp. JV176]|uniref:alpha/beta hydrolase n=1 Tax=Streptomyces sp. JV176 TaxID=858630 RepID=UPI002E78C5F1|nr:alpha/beta hydrolase [Streptomyces sp. JV176]MEE1802340.1 alpha/beta hydrolase [Streptomyces sp. JV176]
MPAVLTWQQLRDLTYTELQNAADGWGEVSNRADAARDQVSNEMTNRLAASQRGEAASAALGRLKQLERNFDYLHTECGLIRTTLNSLAFELSSSQKRLNAALEEAVNLRFTVHPDGSVSYPPAGENVIDGTPIPGGTTTGSAAGTPYGPPLGAASGAPPLARPNPHHATAQDIADRILKAVNEARETDSRFTEALSKLKAPPGLTVDTSTWTDAAADAATIRDLADDYLKNDIPQDKSPAERRAWWAHLTQEQREEYLAVYPDVIGNLDGIPAETRDAANRDNLRLLIGKLEGQTGEQAQIRLAGLKSLDRQLRADPAEGVPPMYLLGIGDQGNGRAIVSFGNPDTARNVSAYVPGLGTALDESFAENDVKRARDTAVGAAAYDESSAAIVWLGYDAPQLPAERLADNADVMFEHNAAAGADAYNTFMAGISATNQNADPHITAIGHSYGSFTVGQAAQRHGGIPGADDIVILGSPGTGADSAKDLGVGKDHVYVGAADNDPVTIMPSKDESSALGAGAAGGASAGLVLGLGMGGPAGGLVGAAAGGVVGGVAGLRSSEDESQIWFGTDPAHKDFGATRFKVDDGARPFIDGQGATPAHSNYFNPERDRTSARNIAKIVAGHGDEISPEAPR